MLNDRNRNRSTGTDRLDTTGAKIVGALAVASVVAALFMWAPWSGPKIADNTAPGTTVGSATRPVTPPAPAMRESVPAAPTTTR
jgi:hypothetical protein